MRQRCLKTVLAVQVGALTCHYWGGDGTIREAAFELKGWQVPGREGLGLRERTRSWRGVLVLIFS